MRKPRPKPLDPALAEVKRAIEASDIPFAEISRRCGVSTSCLRAWMSGRTRRPAGITMDFVLMALGLERGPIQPIAGAKPKGQGLRLVAGGKK